MYDPTIGQFLVEDPSDFEGEDTNLHRYVGNSPTNATDPSGLQQVPVRLPPVQPYAIHRSGDTISVTGRRLTDAELERLGMKISRTIAPPRVSLPVGPLPRPVGMPPKPPVPPEPDSTQTSAEDTMPFSGYVDLTTSDLAKFAKLLFDGMTPADIQNIQNNNLNASQFWKLVVDKAKKKAFDEGKAELLPLLKQWGEDHKVNIPDGGQASALATFGAVQIEKFDLSITPQTNGISLYSLRVYWSIGVEIRY